MDSAIAQRLLALNRDFYERFGADFSATRQRLQPGVMRILGMLAGDESILDLGCGNGEFARALTRSGHRGQYLGLDFSLPLLQDAESPQGEGRAGFIEADLTRLSAIPPSVLSGPWQLITSFATLHHIPSRELRVELLGTIHSLLAPSGRFIHSNWQFLKSARLRARIQAWGRINMTESDIDEGDYLLDWRRGGEGLRYVHQYDERELAGLAKECGFEIVETFYADGMGGKLGLYQTWKHAGYGE